MNEKIKCCKTCNYEETCDIYSNICWTDWDFNKDYCSKHEFVKEENKKIKIEKWICKINDHHYSGEFSKYIILLLEIISGFRNKPHDVDLIKKLDEYEIELED